LTSNHTELDRGIGSTRFLFISFFPLSFSEGNTKNQNKIDTREQTKKQQLKGLAYVLFLPLVGGSRVKALAAKEQKMFFDKMKRTKDGGRRRGMGKVEGGKGSKRRKRGCV